MALALALGACGDDLPSTRIEGTGGAGGSGVIRDAGDDVAQPVPDVSVSDAALTHAAFVCPVASFIRPLQAAVLTEVNASDNVGCTGGALKYDVQFAAGAPNGTPVGLLVGTQPVDTGVVMGAVARFANVRLPQGANTLTVRFASLPACDVKVNVTVNCNLPRCAIAKPEISPTHPELNGVPIAEGGDRVSSPGSDYQVAFEVTTNIEDGQSVRLDIAPAGNAAPTSVTAKANGGKATFAGVTLRPDGTFQVTASCANRANNIGKSTQRQFMVDTAGPVLVVTTPTNGTFIGPNDPGLRDDPNRLVAGTDPTDTAKDKIRVCAKSTSADGVGLFATLGNQGKNLSAGVAPAYSSSVALTALDTEGCALVKCRGAGSFDMNVRLTDRAGNATVQTITGITCASSLPSVLIKSPTGDANFADVGKRLLAATATQELRDLDPSRPGAQTNVVACTDRQGGKARLVGATKGAALAEIGAELTVAAATQVDGCPVALPYVARWTGVTLPESGQDGSGALSASTVLRVDVTDMNTAVGSSELVSLWVDSSAPTLLAESGLCGRIEYSATPVTRWIGLLSSTPDVTLFVTDSSLTTPYRTPFRNGDASSFKDVVLAVGDNQISAIATEKSGNVTALLTPCLVRVGGVISVVTWVAPGVGQNLCSSTGIGCLVDSDRSTPGWQGSLKVLVQLGGIPATSGAVIFLAGTKEIGVASIDRTGVAELKRVSLADVASVVLTARTGDISGRGLATRAVSVDTTPPDAIATLNAVAKLGRQTTFTLTWTAPGDGMGALGGYLVRHSNEPIDASNFDAATKVAFSGVPAAPGLPDSIDVGNLSIEKAAYFAVAPVDSAGNRGPVTATGPVTANFNSAIISAPAGIVDE